MGVYRGVILVQIWCNTISNDTFKTPRDNQTKRGCKLACKRASADCSAVARRMRALCIAPSDNACTAQEYNYDLRSKFQKKLCSRRAFCFCKAVQFVKNPAVLFTFSLKYDIILIYKTLQLIVRGECYGIIRKHSQVFSVAIQK